MDMKKTKTKRQFESLKLHRTFLRHCKESRKRFLQTALFNGNKKLVSWNSIVLDNEVNGIIDMYPTLPISWKESVENYIKTGQFNPPKSATKPIVSFEKALPQGRAVIKVLVFKHTTKKEYIKAWDDIEKIKKLGEANKELRITEFNPTSITKADIVMVELYEQGKSSREIADYLSEHSIEIYGEEKYGEVPVETTIRTRLKTLRRQLGVSRKR